MPTASQATIMHCHCALGRNLFLGLSANRSFHFGEMLQWLCCARGMANMPVQGVPGCCDL
jgi:hypothetical protein